MLGLTPHAVRSGDDDASCATWRIVDEWNAGIGDDGIPYRDKVFAVFPGFEPSLSDGAEGVHLLFLFDPEIGREQYLRAFDVAMNGVVPYQNGSLRNTTNDCAAVFQKRRELHTAVNGDWSYLCLAPHAFSDRGLFKLKSQILQIFPHSQLAAIELPDNALPHEACDSRNWLAPAMKLYRHCFFHSSDAYSVNDIGKRFTLVKMGSPRLESLRQAFLAPDSRMRIAYQRSSPGTLSACTNLPHPHAFDRSWIRRVHIRGGTSFFCSSPTANVAASGQIFQLSPDLTCIIGGRMSGKSTLLDGLRFRVGHPMPTDAAVRKDVEDGARDRFLSGGAVATSTCVGPPLLLNQTSFDGPPSSTRNESYRLLLTTKPPDAASFTV